VTFRIEDVTTHEHVATITKQVPSAFAWCFAPDLDNYKIDFDKVQAKEWKALLLALTIFMDFRYFNTNRNEQEGERRRRGDI